MARSFKAPWICDRNPWAKRKANQRVRRVPVHVDLPDGNYYRRLTNPWDICDWKWQAREWWNPYLSEWEEVSQPWRYKLKGTKSKWSRRRR